MTAGRLTRVKARQEGREIRRPGWVTVVGIVAIFLGGAGVVGAYMTLMAPVIFEAQERFVEEAMRDARERNGDGRGSEGQPSPQEIRETLDNFLRAPDWYGTWSYVSAALKVLASGFVVWAAILLLLVRPRSPGIFSLALGASSTVVLANFFAASFTGSVILMAAATPGLVVLAVNVILLIVTLVNDRSVFR